MSKIFCRSVCALALLTSLALFPHNSSAATIYFSGNSSDGHAVSAKVEFTASAGAVTVKLFNTTADTLDAGELFTGLDFNLGGLTPTLASKTAIQREVFGNGTYTDTGSPQDISWSLISNGGGSYQLNFNPNAKDSIIAPPSGSVYTGNGSINGNNGHNPFAAESATFVLNVPGATPATSLTATTFRFGTGLAPATGTTTIPEPSSCALLLLSLVAIFQKRAR